LAAGSPNKVLELKNGATHIEDNGSAATWTMMNTWLEGCLPYILDVVSYMLYLI